MPMALLRGKAGVICGHMHPLRESLSAGLERGGDQIKKQKQQTTNNEPQTFSLEAQAINKTTEASKVKDYAVFIKLRLASLVVFSAAISYIIGTKGNMDWFKLSMLVLGGFLVTGSSNG